MIETLKEFFYPKTFSVPAYVCLIAHFLFGVILIPVTNDVRKGEFEKFFCAVDTKSTASYKTYVEKICYSRYEHTYNSPLPLYGFVLLTTGLTVFVSAIYSLAVSSRVDEIADRTSNESEQPRTNSEETSHRFCIFNFYFFHLIARFLFGIVFTVLQHTTFYPNGFDFEFTCSLSTTVETSQIAKNSSVAQFNVTLVTCENSTASEKKLWATLVSVINVLCSFVILLEIIYLRRRFSILNCWAGNDWSGDAEFITVYLLRKRYQSVDTELESRHNSTPLPGSTSDCSTPNTSTSDIVFEDCIEFYRRQVLYPSLSPDINYTSKTNLDDLYVDVVIQAGRATHKFCKEMDRQEMFDVYTNVPKCSIRLEKIQDLFYPNDDTKEKFPRTILAVGRPGIGKTVLAEKTIRDWANGIDEFYHGKIACFIKFRWFNFEELDKVSLKTFLRYGTGGLSAEKFECILEEILNEPKKAIIILDGLDEFDGDFEKCIDQSRMLPNDPNTCMSPMALFIKLAFGSILQGATVLVTSRPTAVHLYSKLDFDRSVEIIGFTADKIEKYVNRFCENMNKSELKPKIWNHIKSSSDLLNLCYIPVNSFIVCVTLTECLTDPTNDTDVVPTTLTELYQTAINHFSKYHDRNVDSTSSKQILQKLQELAFFGMQSEQLVFSQQFFNEQMKKSGLVNSLSNPVFPLKPQFCFIHLTIQEFLAAKHVIEALPPDEIIKFISDHIKRGRWHLVLQFIAGLLGEKLKTSGKDYQDCVLAFAKSLNICECKIDLNDYKVVFVMKCLREIDDENMVKKACHNTSLSHAAGIYFKTEEAVFLLSASDWEAMTFVCKQLNDLRYLFLYDAIIEKNCVREIAKLLEQRCFNQLLLRNNYNIGDLAAEFGSALLKLKCTLNHEHAKLLSLIISIGMTDADVSHICAFIKDGRARHLQVLDLSENAISDEGVHILCNALMQGHCRITTLFLAHCSLTAECVRWLSKVLCDGELSNLSLNGNAIGDEGVRMFCTDALGKEQCKLTYLSLVSCGLTDQCVPFLCEILQKRNCKLTALDVSLNHFTTEGSRLLSDVDETEICEVSGL